MDGYEELARMFAERNNTVSEGVRIGTIKELPELRITIGTRVNLTQDNIIPLFDVKERSDGKYINLNKKCALLRCEKKYILLGVVYDG